MPPTDLTKTSSHIIWLWSAIAGLAIACCSGYVALRDRDDCLADKISANELTIKMQLVEIKTTLVNVEATLQELKRDIRRGNDP